MIDDRSILAEHKMEQRANVYLVLDPSGRWVVHPVFVQNRECDGLDTIDDQGCSCDDFTSVDHKRAIALAGEVALPDPVELLRLIIDALFPHDTPPDLTDRATIEAWLADPNRNGPRLT